MINEVSGREDSSVRAPGDPDVAALLHDAVDLHIHTAPDVLPRCVTATSAAQAAQAAGMSAIVLKSHLVDTSARAEVARDETGFATYGGVVLNYAVGGLNPHAVHACAQQGGRVVWMPTVCARHFIRRASMSPTLKELVPPGVPGITVTDGGKLKTSARRVLEAIAEHDLLLASGHLSPAETLALFIAAKAHGVRRMVVTHPHAPFVGMDLTTMRKLAEIGAFLEFTPQLTIAARAQLIREVDVENCVVSTDAGTTRAAPPVPRLSEYLHGLSDEGFTMAEMAFLVQQAPAYLLGLPGHDIRPTPDDFGSKRPAAKGVRPSNARRR